MIDETEMGFGGSGRALYVDNMACQKFLYIDDVRIGRASR